MTDVLNAICGTWELCRQEFVPVPGTLLPEEIPTTPTPAQNLAGKAIKPVHTPRVPLNPDQKHTQHPNYYTPEKEHPTHSGRGYHFLLGQVGTIAIGQLQLIQMIEGHGTLAGEIDSIMSHWASLVVPTPSSIAPGE